MNVAGFGHKPERVGCSVCHTHIDLCIRKLLLISVRISTPLSEWWLYLLFRRTLFQGDEDFCCNYVCHFVNELEWNFHVFYISAHTALALVSDK